MFPFKKENKNYQDVIMSNTLVPFFYSAKFSLTPPESKSCNFEAPPSFSVPLKMHKSPERYECHMSCAVTGNPRPHVTWYKDNISLNTDSNYYITNTCGVCSMMILTVGPRDSGVYTVVAENCLGRVECATKLVIQGKKKRKKNTNIAYIALFVCISISLKVGINIHFFPFFHQVSITPRPRTLISINGVSQKTSCCTFVYAVYLSKV